MVDSGIAVPLMATLETCLENPEFVSKCLRLLGLVAQRAPGQVREKTENRREERGERREERGERKGEKMREERVGGEFAPTLDLT